MWTDYWIPQLCRAFRKCASSMAPGPAALRRAIREYLKDHPLVESSAPAADASGEGVTVVILIG